MSISAGMVRDLRGQTGAGIMDCKNALKETEGDIEKAVDYLRKKGLSKAAKKSGRETSEGVIGSYIHAAGSIGVLLEINCETDFVARNEIFQDLVRDIAMHIAAVNPSYVSAEEVPADEVEREKAVLTEQAKESGKPDKVIPKIVEGRLSKFYESKCLLNQAFVKDSDITIDGLLKQKITELGENLTLRRFVRFQLGGS